MSLQDLAAGYGPLDAFLIAGGAATDSALDQAKRAYLLARMSLAGRWQGPEAMAEQRSRLEALEIEQADKARTYQPMREAHPFATSAGEAMPAFTAGRGSGLPSLQFNMARTLIDQLAQSDPRIMLSLREVANGLKRY